MDRFGNGEVPTCVGKSRVKSVLEGLSRIIPLFSSRISQFHGRPQSTAPTRMDNRMAGHTHALQSYFLSNYFREPDNQRYLFVGASPIHILLIIVQAVMTLQRLRPVVSSGNILGRVPYLSQPLPQPPFQRHSLRNPRNAVSTPPAKRKPTTEVLTRSWPPHMVASERSLRL